MLSASKKILHDVTSHMAARLFSCEHEGMSVDPGKLTPTTATLSIRFEKPEGCSFANPLGKADILELEA